MAKGADKPSITTKDSKIAVTAKKDCKIDLKNLEGDAIDLYVQVVAKDGSKTAVTKIATVTLKETAKTPAKIFQRKLQMERSYICDCNYAF